MNTNYINTNAILAGDFNLVMDTADVTGLTDTTIRRLATDKEQIEILKYILNNNKLKDVYKRKHDKYSETMHYNKSNNSSSMLDRIYTKEIIHIQKVQHFAQTLSSTDHKAVIAHINNTPTVKRGK